MFVRQAERNLGLAPQITNFEKFKTLQFEDLFIRYTYTPKDFVKQEIRFAITDKETIKELQRLFEISSVEPYTLGVNGKIRFVAWNEKNEWNMWDIVFEEKNKVTLGYNIRGRGQSCVANLRNTVFYEKLFELAWENHKKLFPQSRPEEICLFN